jgi:septal ring factor EnvC (AmiA/AmiB activator)
MATHAIAKKAGAAAIEKAFESVMPELFRRLDQIDQRISGLDRELHGLRQHMDSRFEQVRDVINELGQRVARIEGKLEGFTSTVDRQSEKMDQWIERLVRIEMTQSPRRGKRAS